MGDGKGARDEEDANIDKSPQADEKAYDPTDDAQREPTRPVTPASDEMSPPGAQPGGSDADKAKPDK